MENTSWTDNVKLEEVLQRVKEERNILLNNKTKEGYILRRNCILNTLLKEREGKL
jgi:hypothetical protein